MENLNLPIRHFLIVAISILLHPALTTAASNAGKKTAAVSIEPGKFANLKYEQLAADQWRTLFVGRSGGEIDLPSGRSFYSALSLPPVAGEIELRAQYPFKLQDIHECLMPSVTFLDAQLRPTRSFDYEQEKELKETFGWTFNDRTGVRIRFSKRATDRYVIVHTNRRIIGSVISHQFGHATMTHVPVGKYGYFAPGPDSFNMRAMPKGKVYVKLFTHGDS